MSKFLTQTYQVDLFQQILKKSIELGDKENEQLGEFVNTLFNRTDARNKWITYINNRTKDEQEILDALNKGWAIKYVDGVYYYDEDNTWTQGPFQTPRNPKCHVISTRSLNKLVEKNEVTIKFDYKDRDNCVMLNQS